MEEKNTNVWKNALNWGLILGIMSIILSVLMYILDFKPINFTNIGIMAALGLLVMIITLVFALKSYRNNILGGFMTFKEAFIFSLLVVIVSSIISSLYTYIFLAFIDPEYSKNVFEGVMSSTEELLLSRGLDEDAVEQAMDMAREEPIPTPSGSAIKGIINGSIFGVILSLILGAIMKKKNNEVVFEE